MNCCRLQSSDLQLGNSCDQFIYYSIVFCLFVCLCVCVCVWLILDQFKEIGFASVENKLFLVSYLLISSFLLALALVVFRTTPIEAGIFNPG